MEDDQLTTRINKQCRGFLYRGQDLVEWSAVRARHTQAGHMRMNVGREPYEDFILDDRVHRWNDEANPFHASPGPAATLIASSNAAAK